MSNNKQSSVEWLFNKLLLMNPNLLGFGDYLEQAKAQHKKETIDFALHCMMPNLNPDKSTIEVVSNIYDEIYNNENF